MRRMWIGGGFALVVAVGFGLSASSTHGQPGAAGNDPQRKKVTVSGTATIAVKPDTARVSFAVKATGMDFKSAAAECDKKATAVEKAIKDLKIGGLEIKKGPLNFTQHAGGFGPGGFGPGFPLPGGPGAAPPALPAPPPPPPALPGVDVVAAAQPPAPGALPGVPPMAVGPLPGMPGWGGAFEVSRTFTVVASFGKQDGAGNLDETVAVVDKLLAVAPANGFGLSVNNQNLPNRIAFYHANLAPLRQEAIKAAVADALANAKAATGNANLTTKDIVSIIDQSHIGAGGSAMVTGRGEVLGERELTATLSVTFSY